MSDEWIRPSHIPYPNIWSKFRAKDVDSDSFITYRVQDLPENRFDDGINFMVKHFLRDEPFCRSQGVLNDPVSVQEFRDFWNNMLKHKITVVCFREGFDDICGMNTISISTSNDKPYVFHGKPIQIVVNAVMYMYKLCKVYERYNVDKYMGAFGLIVDPKYRQRGIATQLLKARVPILKAINIPISITAFTPLGSQIAASKAGFQNVGEITYNELCEAGYDFSGTNEKSAKTMILAV